MDGVVKPGDKTWKTFDVTEVEVTSRQQLVVISWKRWRSFFWLLSKRLNFVNWYRYKQSAAEPLDSLQADEPYGLCRSFVIESNIGVLH